jgi:hypothetical protein
LQVAPTRSNGFSARAFFVETAASHLPRLWLAKMARVLIGTSGWHYDSWRGPFFPEGLPLKDQLPYYAGQFETTELNGVFYRTPTPEAVKAWREQTDRDFVFAWKASKFITHWKRLSDRAENSLTLLEERISLLRGKAGPILFQLPPQFEVNADRLGSFFKLLSKSADTASNFGTRAGISPASCGCWPTRTYRSACQTITTPRRLGSARRTSSMCVAMVRAGGITATTHGRRSRNGPGGSTPGSGKAATSMSILTTIKRAQPRPMR